MISQFTVAMRRAMRDFNMSTNMEAKYVIIGRDFIESFLQHKDRAEKVLGLEHSGDDGACVAMYVLGMKVVLAPWTTGLTILPDVATCDTFACVTTDQKP